ncbi:riboflavin kinase [Candidatus Kaiserbacteria bacterium]|nr:riboflavin kinase [Candidatus Kaiserbacteria bacterium]
MRYSGVVQEGSKRARELGYPTINIVLDDTNVSGVYIALVRIGSEEYKAAAFADPKRKLLEAYLLDTSTDLYGREAEIELLKHVRDTEIFGDDELLKAAIEDDVKSVREYFHI